MKIITHSQKNGIVGLIFPPDNIESILNTLNDVEYTIVDNLFIDLEFQSAYEFDKELGAKLNIEKAKEVQRNKWREARKKRFEKLDLQFMLALEKGDVEQQKIISTKKQELRDLPNTFLPDDLEEIKSTWPNILLEE